MVSQREHPQNALNRVRPDYCEAPPEEGGLPCICGATVEGKDPVRGVCQARHNGPKPEPLVRIILVHRDTGKPI
jgi:hypothetical protein